MCYCLLGQKDLRHLVAMFLPKGIYDSTYHIYEQNCTTIKSSVSILLWNTYTDSSVIIMEPTKIILVYLLLGSDIFFH